MKIKFSHQAIGLERIARVTRVRSDVAKVRMHTGESIHVKCGVRCPDGCTISYQGTFEELKAIIDKYKKR